MRYEVLYLVGGEEHSDVVDAPDAADAASTVQHEHGRTAESFELLSVNLIDDIGTISSPASDLNPASLD